MKVIFLQDVKGQGKKNELKEVSAGYAENFLIPRGLAVLATDGNVRQVDEQNKIAQRRKDQEKEQAQALAQKLEALTLQMKAKAGEGGRLFGSITSKHISDELKKTKKLTVDRRKMVLPDPIRSLGVTQVQIKLHPDVSATLKVSVIEEN